MAVWVPEVVIRSGALAADCAGFGEPGASHFGRGPMRRLPRRVRARLSDCGALPAAAVPSLGRFLPRLAAGIHSVPAVLFWFSSIRAGARRGGSEGNAARLTCLFVDLFLHFSNREETFIGLQSLG